MMNDGQKRQLAEMHNMIEELTMMYQTAQQSNVPGDCLYEILNLRNKIKVRRDELTKYYRIFNDNDEI